MRWTGLMVGGLLLVSAGAWAAVIKPDPQFAKTAPVPFPFSTWDALLKKYVDDAGRVDYAALKDNFADMTTLEKVYAGVAASSPKRTPDSYPTNAAREAYYLDAYNVLVMGPVGVGKTFLANALGHIAVRRHHRRSERSDPTWHCSPNQS